MSKPAFHMGPQSIQKHLGKSSWLVAATIATVCTELHSSERQLLPRKARVGSAHSTIKLASSWPHNEPQEHHLVILKHDAPAALSGTSKLRPAVQTVLCSAHR